MLAHDLVVRTVDMTLHAAHPTHSLECLVLLAQALFDTLLAAETTNVSWVQARHDLSLDRVSI